MDYKSYKYKGWNLAYQSNINLKSDAPSRVLAIHPVGIGLSSWFYDNIMKEADKYSNTERLDIIAPDLIGCGTYGDQWNPNERGLFLPMDWVRTIETLIEEIESTNGISNNYIILCQGGLAPVGLCLASRNIQKVSHLILCSPPPMEQIMSGDPEWKLQLNYLFLRSPFGQFLVENVLEQKWALKLFSNLFLFQDECDERWIQLAVEGIAGGCTREPVLAFNAGLLNHRSYCEEIQDITQSGTPLIILQGENDPKISQREGYSSLSDKCEVRTLKGNNILPWENYQIIYNLMLNVAKESKNK